MPNLTTADFEQSATGRQIIAEVEERAAAEQEIIDGQNAENCARWRTELDDLAPDYEAMRVDALSDLHDLALTAMVLIGKRARIRTLVALIRKANGDPGDVPLDLFHDARRPFLKDVEIIRERLPRAI